jgi:hypothetical protein
VAVGFGAEGVAGLPEVGEGTVRAAAGRRAVEVCPAELRSSTPADFLKRWRQDWQSSARARWPSPLSIRARRTTPRR